MTLAPLARVLLVVADDKDRWPRRAHRGGAFVCGDGDGGFRRGVGGKSIWQSREKPAIYREAMRRSFWQWNGVTI
jgi:hypothetical protein